MAQNQKTNKDMEFDHVCWNSWLIYDLDQHVERWEQETYSKVALEQL